MALSERDSPNLIRPPQWNAQQAEDNHELLATGGGGGHDGGMDDLIARVGKLEKAVDDMSATMQRMASHIDQHIGRVDSRLTNMPTSREMGEIVGRLSQLPNWWQLMLFGLAVVGAVAAISRIVH